MESSDLLTTEIVEESLRKDLGPTVHLLSWSQKNCSDVGDNFFNEVKRLNVHYIVDGSEKVVSYVAKLNPCKSNDLFNPYRERAMKKEVFFYKELLPLLNKELEKMGASPINVPKYIYSSIIAEKEVIILEDVKPKGYVTFSKGKMNEAHSEIMAKEISKLHAASFAMERTFKGKPLEEMYPLLVESWLVGDTKLREAFDQIFKKGLKHNLKLTKTLTEFEDLIPWFEHLTNKEMETLVKELYATTPWRAIVHGDYHRTNVLFKYNELNIPENVMIIDWQTVRIANVGSELTYLLYSSFFGPLRTQLCPHITNTYFGALKPFLGSKNLTFESLEKELKSNQFGFLICFFLMPLSLCVNHPSELFKIEETETVHENEDEELQSARELLLANQKLLFVLKDYLSYASKTFINGQDSL